MIKYKSFKIHIFTCIKWVWYVHSKFILKWYMKGNDRANVLFKHQS